MDPLSILFEVTKKAREANEDRDVMSLALQALKEKHDNSMSLEVESVTPSKKVEPEVIGAVPSRPKMGSDSYRQAAKFNQTLYDTRPADNMFRAPPVNVSAMGRKPDGSHYSMGENPLWRLGMLTGTAMSGVEKMNRAEAARMEADYAKKRK